MPHKSPAARKLYGQAYYLKNKEARLSYQHQYYAANSEEILAANRPRVKAWHVAHRDEELVRRAEQCPAGSACQSYKAMRARCQNPNHVKYPLYGGRGITIAKRWLGENGRRNFLADMGERPDGTTLDRKRVNGNYTPANCKWSTPTEQRANQRTSPKQVAA